jgi:hypothetical protein
VGLWQDGDGEKTFRFDVDNFRRAAEVVRPHRRRRLSPEGRAKLARRLLAANASRREGFFRGKVRTLSVSALSPAAALRYPAGRVLLGCRHRLD